MFQFGDCEPGRDVRTGTSARKAVTMAVWTSLNGCAISGYDLYLRFLSASTCRFRLSSFIWRLVSLARETTLTTVGWKALTCVRYGRLLSSSICTSCIFIALTLSIHLLTICLRHRMKALGNLVDLPMNHFLCDAPKSLGCYTERHC